MGKRIIDSCSGMDHGSIEQDIRSVFDSTESTWYTFEYPSEYILIAEKKELERTMAQFCALAANHAGVLYLGLCSEHNHGTVL
ncbi:MAG: hypothetical protein VZT48_03600 [Bulleidia sp.]|nr:hypothetical protein [Bulleidia sp.]